MRLYLSVWQEILRGPPVAGRLALIFPHLDDLRGEPRRALLPAMAEGRIDARLQLRLPPRHVAALGGVRLRVTPRGKSRMPLTSGRLSLTLPRKSIFLSGFLKNSSFVASESNSVLTLKLSSNSSGNFSVRISTRPPANSPVRSGDAVL